MLAPTGRRCDTANPYQDAQLPDGSRLNVAIPPVARDPVITIRKFVLSDFPLEAMAGAGALTNEAAEFLDSAVRAQCNILVAGGTGSGKTTFLNALGQRVDGPNERIVVIEETAELQLHLQVLDCVSLQARPSGADGSGGVTIRQLVTNALRMRPTRIIVGEVRGGEARDMLTAMSSGHDGSMCTLHASSAPNGVLRLMHYAQRTEEQASEESLLFEIAAAIDFVVYLEQDHETQRRFVSAIYEVVGVEGGGDLARITGANIFERGRDGVLRHSGIAVHHAQKFRRAGILAGGPKPWLPS